MLITALIVSLIGFVACFVVDLNTRDLQTSNRYGDFGFHFLVASILFLGALLFGEIGELIAFWGAVVYIAMRLFSYASNKFKYGGHVVATIYSTIIIYTIWGSFYA